MLLAALSWATGTVLLKRYRWSMGTAALAGCWEDPPSGRRQYYTATGPDTLDLRLVVGASERRSQVRLRPDGFLEIIGEPSLGETLEWVGDRLIFRINGAQVASFRRCA